jgi:hypothetical protein
VIFAARWIFVARRENLRIEESNRTVRDELSSSWSEFVASRWIDLGFRRRSTAKRQVTGRIQKIRRRERIPRQGVALAA